MTVKEKYTTFLLEKYRSFIQCCGRDAYNDFERGHIFDYINKHYEAIHTQDSNLIIQEITYMIANTSSLAEQCNTSFTRSCNCGSDNTLK